MGWGCYKHEWDAGSPNWQAYLENLCNERLARDRKDWGRDSEICPKCYKEMESERDRLKEVNAGLIETMQELLRLVTEPSRHLPVGKLFAHNRIVGDAERAIAKAEGKSCTTPK